MIENLCVRVEFKLNIYLRMELNKNQVTVLQSLNGKTISQPDKCFFVMWEKAGRNCNSYFQNWLHSFFRYHLGLDDFRGLKEIFELKDLEQKFHQLIKGSDTTSLVDEIFSSLESYDEKIFQFDTEKKTMNIPHQILLLKFLRELLCNPFLATYNFRYKKNDQGKFVDSVVRILLFNFFHQEKDLAANESVDKWVPIFDKIHQHVARNYPWYHLKYKDSAEMQGKWNIYESYLI